MMEDMYQENSAKHVIFLNLLKLLWIKNVPVPVMHQQKLVGEHINKWVTVSEGGLTVHQESRPQTLQKLYNQKRQRFLSFSLTLNNQN